MTEFHNDLYCFCNLIHDKAVRLAPRNSIISIGPKDLEEHEIPIQYQEIHAGFGIGNPIT